MTMYIAMLCMLTSTQSVAADTSVLLTSPEARQALSVAIERNYCVQDLASAYKVISLKDSLLSTKDSLVASEHAKFVAAQVKSRDCLNTCTVTSSFWSSLKSNLEVLGTGIAGGLLIGIVGTAWIINSMGDN